MRKSKLIKLMWYFLTILPIILLILGYIYPSSFFENQETIREFVLSYGVFAPLIFILIQILQVILAPLSHYSVSVVGGFIFGTWQGFFYNWIGRIIGTGIAFYLGRIFGRNLIKKIVKPNTIKKYDNYFERGKMLLFLAYFLPLFPDDELSYLAGFSKIKSKIFLPIMLIGHISGSLGLSYIGNGIVSIKEPLFIIFSIITLFCGIMFILFLGKLKNK